MSHMAPNDKTVGFRRYLANSHGTKLLENSFWKRDLCPLTCHPLLQYWGKTDKSDDQARQEIAFHPLAYHLLDVAACADAILDANPARLSFLADLCGIESHKLRRVLVCLIALHDIGKCARGFQGKVVELWPSTLGPRPEQGKFVTVRHDAAGLWLFKEEPRLAAIGARLTPGLLVLHRETIFQSVVGHHGEPLELDFRRNVAAVSIPGVQIGRAAQLAAAELGEAICAVFDPPQISPADEAVPILSFALAGLTILSDWLGSNRHWFDFRPPAGGEQLTDELSRYWRDVARPAATRAVREAGLIQAEAAPFIGVRSLFPHIDKPTPLQLFCEEVPLSDAPMLFIIEDMTGAGKTEAAVALVHRLLTAGRARGVYIALPTMATANAMFERLSAAYRRLFAADSDPFIVLVHGRRDLCPGFRNLSHDMAHDDLSDGNADDPSETTASAFCADWIARSNKQAFLAQMGAGTIDQSLLAILPARHQALRLWGLADKVLVIDEAHAYDAYMNKELETLLRFHGALGGSAIILSATLPRLKRQSLIDAFRLGLGNEEPWNASKSAYPLVTIAADAGISNFLRERQLEPHPHTVALDAEARPSSDPARIEKRRDALLDRGRWQFGLREEAVIAWPARVGAR